MSYLIRLQIAIVIILLMASSTLFGASATITPSQIPKGAYVNGGDGDQHFFQSILIVLEDNGGTAWANGDYIYIEFPTGVEIGDTDGDGTYYDEISYSWTATEGLDLYSNTAGTATAYNKIYLQVGSGSVAASGDSVNVFFPIITSPSGTGTVDYIVKYKQEDLSVIANKSRLAAGGA